jgi:hypothetical protein
MKMNNASVITVAGNLLKDTGVEDTLSGKEKLMTKARMLEVIVMANRAEAQKQQAENLGKLAEAQAKTAKAITNLADTIYTKIF